MSYGSKKMSANNGLPFEKRIAVMTLVGKMSSEPTCIRKNVRRHGAPQSHGSEKCPMVEKKCLMATQKCLLTTLKCLMAKKQKMSAINEFPLDKRIGVTLVGKLSSEPTGSLSAPAAVGTGPRNDTPRKNVLCLWLKKEV